MVYSVCQMAPLSLIVDHSPLFPAHWSLFVAHPSCPEIGKRVHVEGSVYAGFTHAVQRRYKLGSVGKNFSLLELGELTGGKGGEEEEEEALVKHIHANADVDADAAEYGEEVKPIDRLEKVAIGIVAPGGSLNHVNEDGTQAPARRGQMKNCQDWIIDVVAELVRRDLLPAPANEVVQNAPKN
ncbi:hypothetical protein D8B26_001598 [Coccidioides posadasii str. Silveira]|uniref:Uncharacterized protein n=3 Tax=Coccidioides posadasii TaxID=199306 RepID=E9CVR4_COCPS|nr:conserved hypothetical protein [Coccidioides posadasii str. Silveira]KMM64865.1 hypothetical protein CPAG_01217 [Coccidioides posadasii RMSCC 3488]QVM06895.1 hypothetical protein D8B26_001598 [Coccidioides posadasii str. Silveira]